MADEDDRLTPMAAFCAFLIFESSKEESEWKPYLKTIPHQFWRKLHFHCPGSAEAGGLSELLSGHSQVSP